MSSGKGILSAYLWCLQDPQWAQCAPGSLLSTYNSEWSWRHFPQSGQGWLVAVGFIMHTAAKSESTAPSGPSAEKHSCVLTSAAEAELSWTAALPSSTVSWDGLWRLQEPEDVVQEKAGRAIFTTCKWRISKTFSARAALLLFTLLQ